MRGGTKARCDGARRQRRSCTEGSLTHTTTVSVEVTATDDFAVSADRTSLVVDQRSSDSTTIATAVTSGSAGTVSLTASVSPPGPTASLDPASVLAGDSSTLTVSADSSIAPGRYIVTVDCAAGSAMHSTTITVDVFVEPTPVVTVTSVSNVVPQNGSDGLGCSVTNGVGPFDYSWQGYRDDGAPGPGPFILSSATVQFPTVRLVFRPATSTSSA